MNAVLFGEAVFIMNSKIHLRKIRSKAYFKAILHDVGLNKFTLGFNGGWMYGAETSLRFDQSGHIDRRGKNQFIVGLPRYNMNSKVDDVNCGHPRDLKN